MKGPNLKITITSKTQPAPVSSIIKNIFDNILQMETMQDWYSSTHKKYVA